MRTIIRTSILCFIITCIACQKKDTQPAVSTQPAQVTAGLLKIELDHLVDTLPLVFNKNYVDPKGDTFKVTTFNYFISNIVFTKDDNTSYIEPNSYHLVRHSSPASTTITLGSVPFGSYKSVSFMLGVDSAKSVSGAQGGDLDLSKSGDMYWDWNTGYIFFKLEGTSPKSGDIQKNISYHIGVYSGAYKGQRTFNLSFNNSTISVANNGQASLLHLSVNVNEFFKNPTLIDVSAPGFYDHSTANANNKIFADNYADMISFGHIQNF
jgi:hypothetical protein